MICPRCHREIPDDAVSCCYCGRVFIKRPSQRAHMRPNGSGYVKRRGKTWTAFFCDGWLIGSDGVSRRHYISRGGFSTKSDALAHITVLASTTRKLAAPALSQYWDMYARGDLLRLSESKQTAYAIAWKKLQPIAHRAVDTLSVQDLRRIVEEKGPTYYTARDMKVLLNHLFDLAGADGWVRRDLPEYIILPSLEEKERRPFTDMEQASLWKIYDAGDRRAAMPLIMIYTGMMPGEMMMLRRGMIDLDNQQILGAGRKTKVRRESPIYLPDTIIPVIAEEIAGLADDDLIWPMTKSKFYSEYYAALQAAGCRQLEPYCCRHTTATALAVSEGVAPQTVKKIMRWSTTRMLDRYAHPSDDDARAGVNSLRRADDI